jgi:multisubunit Na+/H+ antiporter MnhE subunit
MPSIFLVIILVATFVYLFFAIVKKKVNTQKQKIMLFISVSVFIIALIESGIFVALAVWTKKKPYTAIVAGLITFIL